MAPNYKNLKASLVPRKEITSREIDKMFAIFHKYYENTPFSTFLRDLNKKDGAFMLRRKDNQEIVGFSTVVKMEFKFPGKKHKKQKAYALFSGDTVIEKAYWGNTLLQVAAAKYAINQKIKNFNTPVFWFLICKGYKTYLLMANYLKNYWPRYDKENDSQVDAIIEALCRKFFPGHYDPHSGLLLFGENSQRLKPDVAEITEEMKEKYPKINFFQKKNPTWKKGTELPCVAEVSLANMVYGSLKLMVSLVRASMGKKGSRTQRIVSNGPEYISHGYPDGVLDRKAKR